MRKIYKKIILLLIFIPIGLVPMSVFGQDIMQEISQSYNKDAEGLIISSIKINKPKRTSVKFIQTILSVKEGDVYSEDTHRQMHMDIYGNANVFDVVLDVTVDAEASGVEVEINIEEKWTLIPYVSFPPLGAIGLAVVESNAFGRAKGVSFKVLGLPPVDDAFLYNVEAEYSDRRFLGKEKLFASFKGQLARVNFTDTASGSSSWGYNESAAIPANSVVRKYQGIFHNSTATMAYSITDAISVNLITNFIYFDNGFKALQNFESENGFDSQFLLPVIGVFNYTLTGRLGALTNSLGYVAAPTFIRDDFKLMYGNGVSVASIYAFSLSSFGLDIDKRGINNFMLAAEGYYGNTNLLIHNKPGNFVNSISGTVRSNKYLAGAFNHNFNIVNTKKIGLTSGYGVDISYYEANDYEEIAGPALSSGVFVTSEFHIKKIDAPIVALGVGYNYIAQYPLFRFEVIFLKQ